ncbi:hypothetical protein RJ639_029896 [Escallonia herrerae]|uniref:Pentatricopeptide repeat-containing protein n=1 Tax=Escallonia herrerae TaxID=1293975 RepID=A0AA88WZ27_9ASTE|nr:hypothetical protein RJ639_029896 [Escallonia herrerae]
MLRLRCIKITRPLLSAIPTPISVTTIHHHHHQNTFLLLFFSTSTTAYSSPPSTTAAAELLHAKDVALSFREWFKSASDPLFDRVFEILSAENDDEQLSIQLFRLNLRLNESLVLDVLSYRKDVLPCLKFFDWAGRQPGFYHTRATFHAIFKILSKAKLMSLMVEFLENYTKHRSAYRDGFYNTLVMGYAVSGKLEVALQLFGKMRFGGIDLDGFVYHVLLNALVEEGYFDVVDMIARQIRMRGFECKVTHSILVKNLCKQSELDKAEAYVRGLVENGVVLSGHVLGVLVGAFCRNGQADKAGKLVEEFGQLGGVPMEHAYGEWIRNLVKLGKVGGALEFLQGRKGYIPEVFRYNTLISRLLRENRLEEVCDLLMEMKDHKICPDEMTMNSVLCFFCKVGMVEVALELYNSRVEFGLTPSGMAYNFLINTLCGDGSVDEAYRVFRNLIKQRSFPGRRTFSILVDALCREGKLDKMMELVLVALERNFLPEDSVFDKFISGLCRTGRVEDGYLIHGELNRLNKVTSKGAYLNLVEGFNKSGRGDISARLLIEMQEKGHSVNRKVFRSVIQCLCDLEDPEKQFFRLLEMHLSRLRPGCEIYNFFIDGAGHAKRPELAREIYVMMQRRGMGPNLSSHLLMLQSYLKSDRIFDALNFFDDVSRRTVARKWVNAMVIGLCRANKPDIALDIFRDMRENQIRPSLQSYEELVKSFCEHKRFDPVVNLLGDFMKEGIPTSSFLGNTLLWNSLKSRELYDALVRSRDLHDKGSRSWMLGRLIGVFPDYLRRDPEIEELEEVIEQCFPLDLYTYNMLLRKVSISDVDKACKLFNRLCQKGHKPNAWTYNILVNGLHKHGRTAEARRCAEEMVREGFEPFSERIIHLTAY